MRNYFTFGDYVSSSFGAYISGSGTYNAPAHEYDTVSVPGRSGDILLPVNRYSNIEVSYPCFISENFSSNLRSLRSALLSTDRYARLTDTYHPDEFRIASFINSIDVDARSQNDAGEFNIIFNCKPQRYLTSGDSVVSVSSGTTLTNPTLFDARPLIHVTGYGTISIGSESFTIVSGYGDIYIDCELMDCYSGTSNANNKVTFETNDFPVLPPGSTSIVFSDASITSVEITPRWWQL